MKAATTSALQWITTEGTLWKSVIFKLQHQTIHIPRRMKNNKRNNDNLNIVAAMMQVVPNFPAPVTVTWPRKNISKAYCC